MRSLAEDGALLKEELFDAEGHPVLTRVYALDGRLLSTVRQEWQEGRQVLRRQVDSTGQGSVQETHWFYGAGGQLERVEHRPPWSAPGTLVVETYAYDDAGRIDFVDRTRGDTLLDHVDYRYDAQGRLLGFGSGSSWERFSYHDDGRLRRHERSGLMWSALSEYDAQGLLASAASEQSESGSRTRYLHDAQGRPLREEEQHGSSSGRGSRAKTYHYDVEGRLALEWMAHDTRTWGALGSPDQAQARRSRVTRRLTYACGTADLLLAEYDTDEDGRPDGRREYTRDAAGNLLAEQATGSALLLSWPARVEYRYACP